ncbi:MAG: hypothetical protein N2560_08875 [Ignavibacteria bacterium]|nr:hypothetical protein [Ignavibacteria bacterium]
MKTLCIVSCGIKKIWDNIPNAEPTKSRNAYIVPFVKKCIEHAEKYFPNTWCILSAKYGFLFPEEIVEALYNVTFNDKSTKPISLYELSEQARKKSLNKFETIIVLGGKKYVNIVKLVFQKHKIQFPLGECRGIGFMMKKLNDSIQSGIPL